MGPALTPACGFLHASTDEAVCEPEGRPAPQPAEGPTTCARRREGRGVLKAAPRNPGFTIDGSPLGADSSSPGGKPCGTWGRRPLASRRIRRPALRRRGSCWRTVKEAAVYAAERVG
ncbi:MAG: hypothetical protein ACO2PM_10570 [Pyrobaculum sp.]